MDDKPRDDKPKDDDPGLDAMEAHAACEQKARPGDGAYAWLGLAAIITVASVAALALAIAAWMWLRP